LLFLDVVPNRFGRCRNRRCLRRGKWRPSCIVAEENSIGQPLIENLWRDGLPVQPFNANNASKARIIEALALALERGQIQILEDPVLLAELQSFQCERLPSGLMR
jgi:hypothetical protein